MSFHLSADENSIRIENDHILKARLKDVDGNWQEASIDLNEFLGNIDGNFQWGEPNFSHSAEDVSFDMEGGGEVPVLRARLADVDGNYHDRDVNLAERIENQNGELKFI